MNFNLKKLIAKKEVSSLLAEAIGESDKTIAIRNTAGTILVGATNQTTSKLYPIKAGDEAIGWVTGEKHGQLVARFLTSIATLELEKKNLAQETLDKYEEINFLYDISGKIATCLGIAEVTRLIIAEAKQLIDASHITIFLYSPERNTLEAIVLEGEEVTRKIVLDANVGVAGYVLRSGKAEIVNDVQSDPRYVERETPIHSLICAPLTIQNETIGVLTISNSKPVIYSAHDLKLATVLTSQTAAALKNALLYEQLTDYSRALEQYSHTLEQKVAERTLELELVNQKLQRLADLDGLTQVANRRRFDEYLNQQWQQLAREGSYLGLILCDVDYFKRYNDTYGHQQGDESLKQIAQALVRAAARTMDLVARYGGEEFAVILPYTNLQGVMQVGDKIRQEIAGLKMLHHNSLVSEYVTLSLGISCIIPSVTNTPEVLIAAADAALYEAKKHGRDRLVTKSIHLSPA